MQLKLRQGLGMVSVMYISFWHEQHGAEEGHGIWSLDQLHTVHGNNLSESITKEVLQDGDTLIAYPFYIWAVGSGLETVFIIYYVSFHILYSMLRPKGKKMPLFCCCCVCAAWRWNLDCLPFLVLFHTLTRYVSCSSALSFIWTCFWFIVIYPSISSICLQ